MFPLELKRKSLEHSSLCEEGFHNEIRANLQSSYIHSWHVECRRLNLISVESRPEADFFDPMLSCKAFATNSLK